MRRFSWRACPDHPHGCGEHARYIKRAYLGIGSSPRVWGTRHPRQPVPRQRRIIPTGVGNTHSISSPSCCCADHPHGCGEHLAHTKHRHLPVGSSPRVWGTRGWRLRRRRWRRIIPTGVGNTPLPTPSPIRSIGSSPRVWGTPQPPPQAPLPHRIIPTGVGNTDEHLCCLCAAPDHPHGCGEHTPVIIVKMQTNVKLVALHHQLYPLKVHHLAPRRAVHAHIKALFRVG